MLAVTVLPLQSHSIALEDVPPPPLSDGAVLVRTLAIGICGTDREIVDGEYGAPPPGHRRLILGHESLGRIEEAPPETGLHKGDLVAAIVRRPDPVPCPACAAREWDMCRNGLYTERGIKARDGYASEQFRIEPEFVIKLDPALGELGVLMEPTSIVAKAWEQCSRIGARAAAWQPRVALITGAGPVGLLAAMIGIQRGLEVHVYDHNADGPKPGLVRDLGGTYHTEFPDMTRLAPDIVIECTGAVPVVKNAIGAAAAAGIVCLSGVSHPGTPTGFDIGRFNRDMVLGNQTVFGAVNANHRHFDAAAQALVKADKNWLARDGDIKVVLDFTLQ